MVGFVFSSTRSPRPGNWVTVAWAVFPARSLASTVPWYLWSSAAPQLDSAGAVMVALYWPVALSRVRS